MTNRAALSSVILDYAPGIFPSDLLGWGFNPKSLFSAGQQGIYLAPWEISTIFGSDGITPIAGFNQSVGKVDDLSSNGNHATQITSSKQPIYKVDANSKPYLDFDGVDDVLDFSILSMFRNVSGATMIAAMRWKTSPSSLAFVFGAARNVAGSTRIGLGGGNAANKAFVGGRRLDTDGFTSINSADDIITTTQVIQTGIVNHATTSAQLRINSTVAVSSSSYLTAGTTSDTDSYSVNVGAIGAGLCSSIALYGLFVAPRVLTDAEILNVENLFKSKVGL